MKSVSLNHAVAPASRFKSIIFALGLACATVTLVVPVAHGMGKSSSSSGSSGSGSSSSTNQTLSAIESIALNIAVIYAQTDPRFAPVLMALNIRTGDDLKRLLHGDTSGINFNAVISYFVIQYAQKNPSVNAWLEKLGVNSPEQLIALLRNPDGSFADKNVIFNLAYSYASQNPKYAPWLAALGITGGGDIAKIFEGKFLKNNLQQQLIAMGIVYLLQKQKLGSNSAALYQGLQLGAFQGLPAADMTAINKIAQTVQ